MRAINLLLFALAPMALAKAPLLNRGAPDSIADNYIVVLKNDILADRIQEHYDLMRAASAKLPDGRRGVVRTYNIHAFNAYHIECDENMLDEIVNNKLIEYVSQDSVPKAHVPLSKQAAKSQSLVSRDDADLEMPWGLGRLSHRRPGNTLYVRQRQRQTYAYILDTGIRTTHQDFDESGHGTHVAGIVAGNALGVDNHTIPIAVKVLGRDTVQDATDNGAISRSVINMSLGSGLVEAADDAIRNAVKAGMTVVVSAGNDGHNACERSPAGVKEVITVGSIDRDDERPVWSNWGECLDVFAPGVDIFSTYNESDASYRVMSGTSMACPHVAGLVTYLMSQESNLTTPAQVSARIKELATKDMVGDPLWSPDLIAFNGNQEEL
ncbi:hypothetical protein DL766_000974 [Monosporascus sp. MC13-8B]|uniref:Peptidase S8/S53 domain-containing protein n=1 Tax=Monosporascus cannonballus TaxID=155416 RepID=A0ABY0H111_9PEZI|nr:hypothetical protein DL762_006789 [Monosporascus cannonballus]RYO98611.1 hypothetical protein DL763_002141 [Monosporascus cannonballus]RYP38396.1 hypothetical protein DL766_000974 [Monosporascus sp. MC13-8B]